MHRAALVVFVLVAWGGVASAMTLTVRNTDDRGTESLRWAIERANGSPGPDVITFDSTLANQAISPRMSLPPLTEAGTTVDGDLDDDGRPDITLAGDLQEFGSGLQIGGSPPPTGRPVGQLKPVGPIVGPRKVGCTIRGLIIVGFKGYGLAIQGMSANRVQACWFGIEGSETSTRPNAADDILVRGSDYNTIGGTNATDRNLFLCHNAGGQRGTGLTLQDSRGNRILNNCFGLSSTTTGDFPGGGRGISVVGGGEHRIGGSGETEGNRFGGLGTGVSVANSNGNVIAGNHFGLRDGYAHTPIAWAGVTLREGSQENTIGGRQNGTANVFAGQAEYGVECRDPGTADNVIEGNYFGLAADGERITILQQGVFISLGAGAQTIGGNQESAANYICAGHTGVYVAGTTGSAVRGNRFGVNTRGRRVGAGIGDRAWLEVGDAAATATGNLFVGGGGPAVMVWGSEATARLFRNTFRQCLTAVRIGEGATATLGDLGNDRTNDDGGNVFQSIAEFFISNGSERSIKAEGNDFGTTSAYDIDRKIIDQKDHPARGVVDYDPLTGGVHPTP